MKTLELTVRDLKRIIKPVIQLQSMSLVLSNIGEVIGIPQPTREKIQKQDQFLLSYRGFSVSFFALSWLRGRGPTICLQFIRRATRLQSMLPSLFSDMVCGGVIGDLKTICLDEITDIEFISKDLNGTGSLTQKDAGFRVTYPSGAFNTEWVQGRDISPLMISDDFHSNTWFISISFNPGAFVRIGNRTTLRVHWRDFAGDLSKSIDEWAARNTNGTRQKTFDEWSEDMVLDFGDEIIPKLPSLWENVVLVHRELDKRPVELRD